jgi:hypothetical protein
MANTSRRKFIKNSAVAFIVFWKDAKSNCLEEVF